MSRRPCAAALAVTLVSAAAYAGDHADSPRPRAEPAADITDIFAWMSPDATELNLVMNVHPNAGQDAAFSDTVQYVFVIESRPELGAAAVEQRVACTFDPQQRLTCSVGNESVTGDASVSTGISSTSGRLVAFAGRRDDPFFFNMAGFEQLVADVNAAAPTLSEDATGCPAVDAASAAGFLAQLGTSPTGGTAQNAFAGQSVLSLVVRIDKTLVASGGPLLGIRGITQTR